MAKGNYLNATSAGTAMAQSETTDQGRSAEEIRQDIASHRESITETVDRLGDRFQQTFDWRTYVSNYPVVAIGIAAGLGFLASGIFKPRPTPAERIKEALADSLEDITGRLGSQLDHVAVRQPGLNQTIKAAATGFLVKAATDFLRDKVI